MSIDENTPADSTVAGDERWADIEGFADYQISSLGRVRSYRRGEPRILKGGPGMSAMRYLRVCLTARDGTKKNLNVHCLVANAFLGARPYGRWALHRDGNVSDCSEGNLYWGTPQQNSDDRRAHGRSGAGASNPNARLSASDVTNIRLLYGRGRIRQVDLAGQFGIPQAHVSRIVRGAAWANGGEHV